VSLSLLSLSLPLSLSIHVCVCVCHALGIYVRPTAATAGNLKDLEKSGWLDG